MRITYFILHSATASYHRTLQQYTLLPLRIIAEEDDPRQLQNKIDGWREGKRHELKVVQVSVSLII
jgi:hypothetical protein